ncbi:hypothetical protein V9T40_007590 [Parthenolecanium corni]|uniref:Calx-beta domain-containing protein n=1 Tax=Parthenolecanium corni TaxID=536013 RepID=A0AAN9Y5Z7_9HEMI
MGHENVSRYPWGPPDTCAIGLVLPIIDERLWNPTFRIAYYFASLLYFFLGTAIITQIFMSAIDRITSHTKKVYLANYRAKKDGSMDSLDYVLKEDEPEIIEVRVWNDTVANLILMAFGTASPEILLSIVETVAHNFESGKLGPATIVGSAAFNLLIITSVCMLALPDEEVKRVHRLRVFVVTGLFSLLAYVWLFSILHWISPNEIELWEASVTFALFPILILFAYLTDRNYFSGMRSEQTKAQIELDTLYNNQSVKSAVQKNLVKANGEIHKENLLKFVKEAKKIPNLKDEEIALLAATKLLEDTSHSSNWHRINSVRQATGSRKSKPVLSCKLQQVYDIIKDHPEGLKLNDISTVLGSPTDKGTVVEFHSPNVAVKENIGQFDVTVCRYGDLRSEVKVRVDSVDGSAKQGEDYVPIREVLIFSPFENEKKVTVKIIDDNKWEPDEEFFLRLTLLTKRDENVRLGNYPIMEVTIIDDDEPGIIMFQKRGLVVKESAGSISIPVVRLRGADGTVSAKWKTVDKSAIAGRDYIGGEGEIIFKHNEIKQNLDISIIDDLAPEKDEYFEVVLSDPTGGAKVGYINRILITISNDDDFNSVAHRLMVLTGANLDAFRVHSETWAEQFRLAMSVNGGDIENATFSDYTLHFFSFFWKVLFAFVPPVAIFDGWLCFFVSLTLIGIITTIIQDLATVFGCLIGLDDTMTAITIVALGTTLPDILGARMVTRAEEHADGALIHISGSIAVNVLIGVGVPWFVAALWHRGHGSVFRVPAVGLGFSVLLFSTASIIAAALLFIRRRAKIFGKAELGGPVITRYLTVFILVSLWLLYVFLNFLQINHVINPPF